MESDKQNRSVEEDSLELIKAITECQVDGFHTFKEQANLENHFKPTRVHPFNTSVLPSQGVGADSMGNVSISMPPSPVKAHLQTANGVLFGGTDIPNLAAVFYSQPMPKGSALNRAMAGGNSSDLPLRNLKIDKRFDSFKTWSGRLERQISNLHGVHSETEEEPQPMQPTELSADRYFDALEGPELDTLRASEEIILPEDNKWPFLLRFPISSFGICLGVSSQAIMWKALASSDSTKFLHVSKDINLVLWLISIALVPIVSFTYSLKIIFYFEAVRREYYHPIRANFFFAPFIALLFLALGMPPSVSQTLPSSLWYILMAPIFCLELKIYGQWMSGGQRRLSKVANPSNHLSVVGNFVGALLGASMGLKEGPVFFFAVGLAHYVILFVTLYQRLPTNETLPRELHPVFFLFVAAPSVASMAWARIQGSFDYGSQIAFFIALFLYFSLAVRVNFFRGFRFSLSWWAYTFPMTGAAIATIRYSTAVPGMVTKSLTIVLCAVATLTVVSVLITTIIHAFLLKDLFPNDIAIAISERKPKSSRKWYHRRSSSSDSSIGRCHEYLNSDASGKEDLSMKNVKAGHPSKVVEA